MSLKERLTIVEKNLGDLNSNIKTYKHQVDTLRLTKETFEKNFNAKNTEIKKNISDELDRVFEQLKKHLNHHKNQNARIQIQLNQLRQEKQTYQNYLKNIREKLQDIQRQVGQ